MTKQQVEAKAESKPLPQTPIPIKLKAGPLEGFEASDHIKEALSKVLESKKLHDPKRAFALLGASFFAVIRDVYMEVDMKGDPTAFVSYYLKESAK